MCVFIPVSHDTNSAEAPALSSTTSPKSSPDIDQCDTCTTPASDTPFSADDYKEAFANIEKGVVRSQECLVLISLLQSADTDTLADGLQIVTKLSVTSTENKVCLVFLHYWIQQIAWCQDEAIMG